MIKFDKGGSDNIDDENESRKEYIDALREVDNGNYEWLKRFMFPEK